jgi:alpha-beta hydrolase superfamily lysophospholipase
MRNKLFPVILLFLLFSFAGVSRLQAQIPDARVVQAEQFLDLLVNGKYEEAESRFDSVVAARLPAPLLQQVWESLQKQVGKYKEYVRYTIRRSDPYFMVLLTCRFEKDVLLDLKLVYEDDGKISGIFFLPSQQVTYHLPPYVDTTRFHREPLIVQTDSFRLRGELTTPVEHQIYPVVVLVQGSGPSDLDESIGPNKIFKDIAYGLSSHGIAVIRYDKRTYDYGRQLDADTITVWSETIEDAVSAVQLAEQIPGADGVFLLGHSLGAYLAPRIAAQTKGLSGLILLAGNTRPLEKLVLDQMEYLFSLDTLTDNEKVRLDSLRKQVERIRKGKITPETPREELLLSLNANYWLDLRKYDPVQQAKALGLPMLIMQGGRDYQVTTVDFGEWKHGLSSRNNVDFRFYPALNHLFIAGEGKSTPVEYMQPGHVSEEVIRDIVEWVKTVAK